MIYFLYPLVVIIYLEILGKALATYFKRSFNFGLPLGFLAIVAFTYVTSWPISAFNLSYKLLNIYYCLLFIISFIFIIYRFKKINWHYDLLSLILFFLATTLLCYFSYRHTLGETHGFDTLYYVNFITYNIGAKQLNTLHPHFGTFPNTYKDTITYVFQSFYYLIPVLLGNLKALLKLVGVRFEILPAYVWGLQIIAHALFVSVVLSVLKALKLNRPLTISMFILFILFMGNFYYNQVYGFIGNNLRMSMHAYGSIFLFSFFKTKAKEERYLFYGSLLSLCGLASTGTFSAIFILFGLFFSFVREFKVLREYLILLYIPTLNIVMVRLGAKAYLIALTLVLFISLYYLSPLIEKLYQNKYIRYLSVLLLSAFTVVMSYRYTHNIWNFNIFFNNYSEIADMSWDYFMFNDLRHHLFNSLILIPLAYYLYRERKSPFGKACLIIILIVYNPFSCTYINKINWVYYRSYDLWINYFTIAYFVAYLIKDLRGQKQLIGKVVVLGLSLVLAILQIPHAYNETFLPSKDYNPIYKIDNKELEVINNVQAMVKDLKIDNPSIITPTFYMPSFIEGSTYLIGKEKRYNYDAFNQNSYALYLIFFPHDNSYDNFYPKGEKADYDNCKKYLINSNYDILIIDNNQYYQTKSGKYLPLSSLVEECGYLKSQYSTAYYCVYDLRGV